MPVVMLRGALSSGRGSIAKLAFGPGSEGQSAMTMRLSEVVETSRRVGDASGRLAKIGHLAALLAQCAPEEAAIAVALLSGTPRQGRSGIGYATLREARAEPAAAEPSITLAELDRALDKLKSVKGQGAAGERLRAQAANAGH